MKSNFLTCSQNRHHPALAGRPTRVFERAAWRAAKLSLIALLTLLILPPARAAGAPKSPPRAVATNSAVAAVAIIEDVKSVAIAPARPAVVLHEIKYTGKLADQEARFDVELDLESFTAGDEILPLFEGDVAVLTSKLPAHLRLMRIGKEYRVVVERAGRYRFHLDLAARVTRAEPWNHVSFTGPQAAIASVSAETADTATEVQLLTGTPVEKSGSTGARAILGVERKVTLRWQSRVTEAAKQVLLTCLSSVTAQVSPTVIKYTTQLKYEVLQGAMHQLGILLPANQSVTRIQGDRIRDWAVRNENGRQTLVVEFLQPAHTNGSTISLTIQSEQANDGEQAQIEPPRPDGVEREQGTLNLLAEDVVLEPQAGSGLRRINAAPGVTAAYEFFSRADLGLAVRLRRIEPEIAVADRVSTRLEESRWLVSHALTLHVQRAGIYTLELATQPALLVTDVKGEGVEDWNVKEGRLQVNFSARVLGSRRIEVLMEQAWKDFPAQVRVAALLVENAVKQSALIGAAAAAGLELKTAEMDGLRETPATGAQHRTDETLLYTAEKPGWSLAMASERLKPRITAEVFNLITIGDGLVGGSATLRYGIIAQGVQEFRVRVPSEWKNVEFTGPNIRRKELVPPAAGATENEWVISLQEKAWGGYTMVVTYDAQFDPHKATLPVRGAHAVGAERETGTVAVTGAANLQLKAQEVTDPLRRIDETELSATDRAIISRSVLHAFHYEGATFAFSVEVTRFSELPVIDAVADRTQITTVLTEHGQMLTQASFMVKNNDKQYQRFTLPAGAKFWGCYVGNEPVKAEQDGAALLVPLPRGSNRDAVFAVDIVYAEKTGDLKGGASRELALTAPKTDVPNTYNEWELYVPTTHRLANFGGNMIVAQGTTYTLHDAWRQFVSFYQASFAETMRAATGFAGLLFVVLLAVAGIRQGWRGAIGVIATFGVLAVLVVLLMPSIDRSRNLALVVPLRVESEQLADLGALVSNDSEVAAVNPQASTDRPRGADDPQSQRIEAVAGEPASPSVLRRLGVRVPAIRAESATPTKSRPAVAATAAGRPVGGAEGGFETAQLATVAASPAPPPTVTGIRPLHIDVPRAGGRFVFTKVLNVLEEPLRVSASAATVKSLAMREAGSHATAFLCGVALLIWQMRAGRRASFVIATGLALVIGALGSYLLAERVLHLALIGVAPLAVLACAAWAVAWFWSRTGRSVASSSHLPDPGASPAAAASVLIFALLSTLPAEAKDVVGARQAQHARIETAQYVGSVGESTVTINASLEVTATEPGQTVSVLAEDVAVRGFTCSMKGARLVREERGLGVLLPRRGTARIQLSFLVRHTGDAARRQFSFAIPPALFSRLEATIEDPDAAVEAPTAVSLKTRVSEKQTRVEALLGAATRVELAWTPRIKRAAEVETTLFCRNNTLFTFTGGRIQARATLAYQVSQGELRQLRIQLPRGQKLMRVSGDRIRTWNVVDEGGQPILVAELAKGVAQDYRLILELEQSQESGASQLHLETVHALGVRREDGLLAIVAGEDLSLAVRSQNGLQKVDPAEFERAAGLKTPGISSAFRYLKPGFDLAVAVEAVKPVVEVAARHSLHIGANRLVLSTDLQYSVRRAGLFSVRMALPAGFQVDRVTGDKIAQWNEKSGESGKVVEVTLKQRTLGALQVRVELSRPLPDLPKTLDVEAVHPLDVQKVSGFVAVLAEDGVQTKTSAFTGLTEVPASQAAIEMPTRPAGGVLGFKLLAVDATATQSWKLTVANEMVEAWIRAEIASYVTLSDSLAMGRALIRYEIANAPAREFQLKVPAEFKNVEITGAGIRRRDQTGDVWRVELQNKQRGVYLLTVTWEQPWNGKDGKLNALSIQAQGVDKSVERETGWLAMIARPPLQLAADTVSPDLIRSDSRDLPEWANKEAVTPTLVYHYLRPGWQLALNAKRFTEAEVLQALVENARLTTVVAEDGQMMTELSLSVRNNGRQFIEITLPGKKDTVWSASVAGQAVRPILREGHLLLPLDSGGAGGEAVAVQVTYVSHEPFPRTRGTVGMVSPRLDVPLKDAHWTLFLPPNFSYTGFGGTMSRQSNAIPVYSSFSLSEYRRVQTQKFSERVSEANSNLSNARGLLSAGNLKEAADFLSRAKSTQEDAGQNVDEVKQLEADLKKSQALRLIDRQNEVSQNYQNANPSQAPALPADATAPVAYAAAVAEEQYTMLCRAQEIAVTKARPLHVNLPQRGLSLNFGQILQTEPGKPMTIEFHVADLRAPDYTSRLLAGAIGFFLLWALTARINRPRHAEARLS